MERKLGSKIWLSLIIFGLFGQVAWVVENMYFNVFMYKTVTFDLNATAAMVAASAVVATVFTVFAGNLSDKLGKRKLFISAGYILWGFSLMVFAAISVGNTQKMFPAANAVVMTVVLIIIMDCVMTALGSTANDAAFNAWVTDVTNSKNRGKAESVLSIMSVIALLVVFGAFDGLTKQGKWKEFFLILGSITAASGVLGLFLIKDSPAIKPKKTKYFKDVLYGFRLSTIKENKYLYIIFAAMAIIGVANNIYMPYLIVYIEFALGISDYSILLGVVILLSSALSVITGVISDKYDRRKFFLPILGVYIAGCLGMFFAVGMVFVSIAGIVLMTGNLALAFIIAASARDLTPADKSGLFQGIRMVFYVLIPMCVGPFIGSFISRTSNATYTDPVTFEVQPIPSRYMFIGAIAVVLFILIPLFFIMKMDKSKLKLNDNTKQISATVED
ncbi:MAG: MFS transporter [Clostridia bacterium]|nr:MFS transporter [Clostridia bacterium]